MENENENAITIAGKEIPIQLAEINILELEYYPENPRINYILMSCASPVTQEIIEEKLWDQDSVKDLYQDIRTNMGLLEEILVKGKQVIEGNSRLCAYRHLYYKAQTKQERKVWEKIKCKILPDTISEEEVFILLGTFHIKLKAQWKPFEKASYEYRMVQRLNKSIEQLAKMLSENSTDIQSDIDSYETMIKYNIKDIDKFSYFREFYKNSKLKSRLKEDNTFLDSFITWVNSSRIPRAESVRVLDNILDDKKISLKFIAGTVDFEEALLLTKERHPEMGQGKGRENIYTHMKKMEKRLKNIPIQKIKEECEKDKHKRQVVEYFVKEVGRFADNIGCIRKYKGN